MPRINATRSNNMHLVLQHYVKMRPNQLARGTKNDQCFTAYCSMTSSQPQRRRAQCKDRCGKKKNYTYTTNLRTYRHLPANMVQNVVETFAWNRNPREHGSRASHRTAFSVAISYLPKALYVQNISNLAPQACRRPQEGYVGSGCHASALSVRNENPALSHAPFSP